MATQTVEFPCVTGQTVTAKLFSFNSDTVVATASATEATNRKGLYSVAYTDVAAGTYRLIAFSGSTPLASWDVALTLTTATFQVFEVGSYIILDATNFNLAILAGTISDAQTSAETYAITRNGSTYTIDFTGLDSTGNRGGQTLTKS